MSAPALPVLEPMRGGRTYRLDLQYDGTGLYGWAKQKGLDTVEGHLERAFGTLLGRSPGLTVAGRTDAGVHARRQVVSFDLSAEEECDCRRLLTGLNALTPPTIAITSVKPVAPGFDARKDAKRRGYRYHLWAGGVASPFWRPYSWWVPAGLDEDAMMQAAVSTVGRHDFTAFTPTETEHVFFIRTVSRCLLRRGPEEGLLVFEIEADAFLRHMVRVVVGTLVEVGRGKRSLAEYEALLRGATRDEAGPTAPARGLFLWEVGY